MKPLQTSSFQTIKTDILQRIRNREWQAGAYIPNEVELSKSYGCSRVTVNRALRELAEAGIVERRRKAGTRVVSQPARAANLVIPIVRKDIESRGAVYRYTLLERIIMPAAQDIQAKLALKEPADVLHVRCLHYADETPYQYEDRWISLLAVPKARDETFEETSPNEWLVENEPLLDAEHVFSAQNATDEQARLLDIRPGDALFVVKRRTWSTTRTITVVKLYHPGATFQMISRS